MPSISVVVGIILGSAYVVYYTLTALQKKFREDGHISPEARLPPMVVGACLLPVGLFWFAGSSSPQLNAWPQIIAGIPTGFGLQVILLQSLAYLIDIYTTNANSAIAGTVVVRSLLGGLFPLVAIPMYRHLGVSFPRYTVHVLSSDSTTGSLGNFCPGPRWRCVCACPSPLSGLREENSRVEQVRAA